jgi:hypothetical protein
MALAAVPGPGAQGGSPSRALWVWDAAPLLGDRSARDDFLEFCLARGITTAWVQVTRSPAGDRLLQEDNWRELLGDARRRGIGIHALDGDPDYVRRERHAGVLQLVDTIIRFNREAHPDERFDGIHLDNEPHLLAEWHLPVMREQLLAEYLALNARVQRIVRAEGGLEYGVDIPFWWQYPDDETGAAIGEVTFEGVRKAASFHILDLVDNAGVMAYRNVAGGSDGIIAHASELLKYGTGTGAKIFVGVETSPLEKAEPRQLTFGGHSNARMNRELALAHAAFIGQPSYAGFAIHHYASYRDRYAAGGAGLRTR